MKDIINEIEQAYQFISSILVAGDAAEGVAATRVKLRNALVKCNDKLREEEEQKKESEETPENKD